VKRRVRWTCPQCDKGALGPGRPRKNNAVRYCLPCTAKTGKLVERECLTLEKRRERKVEAKKAAAARKRERTAPKSRRTSRSWMQDERYVVKGGGYSFNVMEMTERMCKSTKWDVAVNLACDYRKRHPRQGAARQRARHLWQNTMKSRGASGVSGAIRIQRSQQEGGSYNSGRGGDWYGVTVTVAKSPGLGGLLMTLLHEVTHYVHLGLMSEEKINGKRRPHGMDFNLIQGRMAQAFWGYKFHPYEAGYSVGRGYAPSRHLEGWLNQQIKERNPRVMRWFNGGAK